MNVLDITSSVAVPRTRLGKTSAENEFRQVMNKMNSEQIVDSRDFLDQCETGASALYYAEKYGLSGMTAEEQRRLVLGSMKVSSAEELRAATEILRQIGALTVGEALKIDMAASFHATYHLGTYPSASDLTAALHTKRDWSVLLNIISTDGSQDVYDMLSDIWGEQPEDKKLTAIIRKVDVLQEAIREEIELRNKERLERELLGKSAAEAARLQALYDFNVALAPVELDIFMDTGALTDDDKASA